jgi:Rha family phage regulatory protein
MKKEHSYNSFNGDLVLVKENKLVTTSLIVAKVFNKRHADVLTMIKNLDVEKNFFDLNFKMSSYLDSTGRSLLMYKITFKGFILLSMGLTGKDKIPLKLQIIESFEVQQNKLKSYLENYMIDDEGNVVNGFVYIIKDYSGGYYKIGKTIDLERRLMQLRTGNIDIEIICSLQDINYGLIETKLHRENEDKLIYGEWFDIEDRLEDIIQEYGFVYHLCNKEEMYER